METLFLNTKYHPLQLDCKLQPYISQKSDNDNKTEMIIKYLLLSWGTDCIKLYRSLKLFLLLKEIPSLYIFKQALYLRQPSCAGHRGPGRSHQTGRREQGRTSGWQISGPEPPKTSDLQIAAASLSSHLASLWTTPTQQRGGCVIRPEAESPFLKCCARKYIHQR